MTAIGAASKITLHPLTIRLSDDDPTSWVVGRVAGGEFVELPEIGVDAIRLLDSGLSVAEVEQQLASDDERPDVAGLLDALVDLSWVAEVDGQRLPDPIGPATVQLAWLRPHRLRWLFTVPMALGAAAVVLAAVVTVIMNPDLLPSYRDFFWIDYPGLASVVNTAMFVVIATVHEFMHLAAARSLGLPARIGLGTRLSNLALQTDVSAAWAVPRRQRYRIYLVGMVWDGVAIAAALLVSAYVDPAPLVRDLLAAFVLVIGLSLVLQTQVYMRTDVFFVLMDLLRCGNLFHDGLAFARYLAVRTIRVLRGRPAPPDPSRDLPARQRRAVRIYAPLVVLGSSVALSVFAFYFIPLLVDTSVRAIDAMVAMVFGGSLLRAVDGALVLTVQWGLQVLFLVTFYKSHPTWFRWGPRQQRGR